MPDTSPLTRKLEATVPAAALTVDADQVVGEAPFAGTVSSVSYTAEAAVTGAAVETRTISLVNKGAAGVGTTVVASLALLSGVNLVAFDEKPLTLSAVAGATTVAEGDVLVFVSTHSGSTGLADPGGLVQVEITRA